jgi:tRNA pseudouridine55 synthase
MHTLLIEMLNRADDCIVHDFSFYSFLQGSKAYRVEGELGYETATLDRGGDVTKNAPYDHVTRDAIESVLPAFTGKIQQIPPIYSAIQKDGKRLYKEARKGKTADDIQIDPREVEVYSIKLVDCDLPRFTLDVECGGGTYIRSLIRDIGYKVNSVATTTILERTKQGQFLLEDTIRQDDWSADNFFAALDKVNAKRDAASKRQD